MGDFFFQDGGAQQTQPKPEERRLLELFFCLGGDVIFVGVRCRFCSTAMRREFAKKFMPCPGIASVESMGACIVCSTRE